jgi:uncharacterized protein (TIGR00369 family)
MPTGEESGKVHGVKHPILELVRGDLQLLVAHVPHARLLGLTVLDVRPGECWIRMPYSERLVGNVETGVVHGGVITTLLDQCGGSSVMAALEEVKSIATLDLRIDYMKPATPGRDIVGYSRCYKLTRNVAFARAVAYHDRADDPIATAVGTFMLGANRAQPAILNTAS